MHVNFEFKAVCPDLNKAENILLAKGALFIGTDHQTDTYFHVLYGRLKLREGNIENALIHYERNNTAGAKQSDVKLYQHQPDPDLKSILEKSLGVKAIVDKKRKIFFIDNVKFHLDIVEQLGNFIEVEAIDIDGAVGVDILKQQCSFYASLLKIEADQYIAESYSDLLLVKKSSTL